MTCLYIHGSYSVRYSPMLGRYIVAKTYGAIEIEHSDYPANDNGLLLAKACADLQAQLEKELPK